MLEGAVEAVAACAEVGTGQAHVGQACAVGAASDGADVRLYADALHGLAGVFYQVEAGLDLFLHVAILLADGQGNGALAILFVDRLFNVTERGLASFKQAEIVVADDIVQTRGGAIALHVGQVEKALQNCDKPITVAVMGCIVNGPGEAREADIGIAGGEDCGVIFVKGEIREKVAYDELLPKLLEYIKTL